MQSRRAWILKPLFWWPTCKLNSVFAWFCAEMNLILGMETSRSHKTLIYMPQTWESGKDKALEQLIGLGWKWSPENVVFPTIDGRVVASRRTCGLLNTEEVCMLYSSLSFLRINLPNLQFLEEISVPLNWKHLNFLKLSAHGRQGTITAEQLE